MSQFWLISLPVDSGGSKDSCWNQLKQKTLEADLSVNYKLAVPGLRVGTLDSLLALSDDLVKITAVAESTTAKVRRQIGDLDRTYADDVHGLLVDGVPVERYLTAFQWDEAKHPVNRPLKETIEKLSEDITKLDDDMKVRVSEYNGVKSQLTAMNRKSGGSLAVRDLSSIVKPEHIVTSENLVTLFVVVPRFNVKEWLSTYENLTKFVVPRSGVLIFEDNDYSLYSVVLFERVKDDFKNAARDKGVTVRELTETANASSSSSTKDRLEQEESDIKSALLEWCKTSYSEAFSTWVHLSVVRIFVESILRYGLPPCFLASVIKPNPKCEARLRTTLSTHFGRSLLHWKTEEDNLEDLHPYVSLTFTIV
ncbi:V-type proton ATPase subunit C [Cymbomonas tetramitiformis]|uniref:V-type proton ATPase subunit C n=1 Tax=Cymbomonas tetramitiformis TaxID=36881 RepID=A0AAE0FME7_9CHLO|nr:V-type proton ATPase subunit C [Cymbomonas tetramitiformis]|eukprot:gene9858-11674_t